MERFSAFDRPDTIKNLQTNQYDLLIIGGGITGAGIALDASSRGLKTALIEKNDFASGTSSRSTKLIHGGLRYLKQFEIALVREVGTERAIVHDLAPHLVTAEKMLLPLIEDGTFGKILTSFGLMVYDVLAGVEEEDQRKMLSKEETLKIEPLLPDTVLKGSGLYAEYRTDDARLTVEVLKTAAKYEIDVLNYAEAKEFIYENEKVVGVNTFDTLDNHNFNIKAKYVVSAAGPWVDDIRDINHSKKGKQLHLTKGVHIVIPHEKLPLNYSNYFDVEDGRMIFAIPRGRITYVGTTDTDYHGDKEHVITKAEDAQYLINAVNQMFPSIHLTINDIISSWAGLRPLIHEEGKSSSELSRKDEIFESSTGLLSIAGGKLTGYRKMAQRIVDLVVEKHKKAYDSKFKPCTTNKIVLGGGVFTNEAEVSIYISKILGLIKNYGFDKFDATYLVRTYGRQTDIILEKYHELKDADQQIRMVKAEAWFCIHHEMAMNLQDFFIRRTGRLYFSIVEIEKLLDPIANDFAQYFGWNSDRIKSEKEQIRSAINDVTGFKIID